MARYYLLRHGEVEAAYKGAYIGWSDPALEPGQEAAVRQARERLPERVERLYCSDLLRCRQTLEMLEREEEPVFLSALREKDFGPSEGLTYDQIRKRRGIEYVDFLQWVEALGGEPLEAFRERVEGLFFREIFREEAETLVVTHAGVIRMVAALLEGRALETLFHKKLDYWQMVVVEKTGNDVKVLPW